MLMKKKLFQPITDSNDVRTSAYVQKSRGHRSTFAVHALQSFVIKLL